MADDILKNIPLPADLPENWTSDQIVAPTGAEVGMDEQHGYNYLMKQVNNAQKAATAMNEGKLGLHDAADNGVVASGPDYVRFGDGTQICWGIGCHVDGYVTETNRRVNFPVAFVINPSVIAASNANIGTSTVIVGWESTTGFSIGAADGNARGDTNWIAIGRWK